MQVTEKRSAFGVREGRCGPTTEGPPEFNHLRTEMSRDCFRRLTILSQRLEAVEHEVSNIVIAFQE